MYIDKTLVYLFFFSLCLQWQKIKSMCSWGKIEMERISKLNCEVISAVQIRFLVDTVRSSRVRLFCRQGSFLKSSLILCPWTCYVAPGVICNIQVLQVINLPFFSKLKSRPYKFYFLGFFFRLPNLNHCFYWMLKLLFSFVSHNSNFYQ